SEVDLRYEQRRVSCRSCGVVVERVPWAEPGSGFTLPMEEHTAYLAQRADRTTVTTLMRVAWRTVGSIIRRAVRRHRSRMGDPLDGLRIIGVDELSYRRHHEYITTVVDHERGVVVWAAKGKNADTLKAFFELLGPEKMRSWKQSPSISPAPTSRLSPRRRPKPSWSSIGSTFSASPMTLWTKSVATKSARHRPR